MSYWLHCLQDYLFPMLQTFHHFPNVLSISYWQKSIIEMPNIGGSSAVLGRSINAIDPHAYMGIWSKPPWADPNVWLYPLLEKLILWRLLFHTQCSWRCSQSSQLFDLTTASQDQTERRQSRMFKISGWGSCSLPSHKIVIFFVDVCLVICLIYILLVVWIYCNKHTKKFSILFCLQGNCYACSSYAWNIQVYTGRLLGGDLESKQGWHVLLFSIRQKAEDTHINSFTSTNLG